jgi:hypothetical protein
MELVDSIRWLLGDDSPITRAVLEYPANHNLDTSVVVAWLSLREKVEQLIKELEIDF